jgi:hypothetical protein
MDDEKRIHALSSGCDKLLKQRDKQAKVLNHLRVDILQRAGESALTMVDEALKTEIARASSDEPEIRSQRVPHDPLDLDTLHKVQDKLDEEEARGLWDL